MQKVRHPMMWLTVLMLAVKLCRALCVAVLTSHPLLCHPSSTFSLLIINNTTIVEREELTLHSMSSGCSQSNATEVKVEVIMKTRRDG